MVFKENEYDFREDWVPVIDGILRDKYGNHIGTEIKAFIPIFYDTEFCPSHLLMVNEDCDLLNSHANMIELETASDSESTDDQESGLKDNGMSNSDINDIARMMIGHGSYNNFAPLMDETKDEDADKKEEYEMQQYEKQTSSMPFVTLSSKRNENDDKNNPLLG